jgi:anaerobic selenocysteine-containing dehydrogenase
VGANKTLSHTHRGHPSLFMNPEDMLKRGLIDDEEVRVHNDMDSFNVRVKTARRRGRARW